MSQTMRAAVLEHYGRPLRVVSVPRPEPGPGQVLVRMKASGTNPLDLKIAEGAAPHACQAAPAILGLDMAGVIEAVGPGVHAFKPSDEVYGMVGGVGGVQGTLAEFAAVDADLIAVKPASLSFHEAAILPLVVITAWEGLVDRMQVKAGQSVLVIGGAGGVGRVVVQLGCAFGGKLYATGSDADRQAIEEAGATFIDRNEAVADYVGRCTEERGFDLVYDTVGGTGLDDAFAAVGKFGHVTSALGWGTHALAPLSFKAASYSGIFTLMPLLSGEGRRHHGEILREAAQLVEGGKLSPRLHGEHFKLETANDAYRAIADRRAKGKIAIDIN
jgi:NADPH:quinone reductase